MTIDPLDLEIVRLRTEEALTHRQIAARVSSPGHEITRHYVRHVLDKRLGHGAPRGGVVFPKREMTQLQKKGNWPTLIEQARADLLDDIRAEVRDRPLVLLPAESQPSGVLAEFSPVDVHMGKLSWRAETGVDYDLRISERVFTQAVEDVIRRTAPLKPEAYVLVAGNDLTQTDGNDGTTTAGTYVDTDSRWVKSFRRARAVNSWAARQFAQHAPVRIVVVPGNHDRMTAWTIGEVLAMEFADHPRITVDNEPRPRKYVRWGVNLLGFVHGDQEKQATLPLIMAQERKQDWAETEWREWHTGHLHKSKEVRFTAGDSFNGVRVRTLPALCAADKWHSDQGYVGEQRAAECYLWHRENGYYGHFSSNVPALEAAA
jgi:hypothetical protein